MLIRLAENFRAVFYAPFYASIALGYHDREGVEIRLIEQATPGAGTAALLDGSIDVTWGGPMRVMKARDEGGPPLVCFCEIVRRDPFYLVARPGVCPGRDLALATLGELRFASVAEVPTPWLCLQHDLREAGIDPTAISRVADRTMAENLAALEDGKLDVVQMFEPFAAMAERRRIGHIVHRASARGETSYTTFLALADGVERNRAAFAAMVRAMRGMQTWLAMADGTELAAVVAPYYPHVDRVDLAAALTRYKAANLWASDPAVSRAGFDRLAASLLSGGFIRQPASYADCVADRLVT
jgi:NitT/TauT family transport system substrate-binding protein